MAAYPARPPGEPESLGARFRPPTPTMMAATALNPQAGTTCCCSSVLKKHIDGIESQLHELGHVPVQLNAVLESLGAIHTRMHELAQVLPTVEEDDPDSDGDVSPRATERPPHLSRAATSIEKKKSVRICVAKPRVSRSSTTGELGCGHQPASIQASISRKPSASKSVAPSRNARTMTFSNTLLPQVPTGGAGGRGGSLSSNVAAMQAQAVMCQNRVRRPSLASAASSGGRRKSVNLVRGTSQEALEDPVLNIDAESTENGHVPGAVDENVEAVHRNEHESPPAPEPEADRPHDRMMHPAGSWDNISPALGYGLQRRSTFIMPEEEAPKRGYLWLGPYKAVLHPHAKPRLTWDVFIIIATVFTGLSVPVEMAYLHSRTLAIDGKGIVLTLVDILFVVDVLLNFRTGFTLSGRVILDPDRIALHYGRNWFLIDLLAALPKALFPQGGHGAWIFRTLKLMRLARIGRLFAKLQQAHPHSKSLLLTRVFLLVLLFANLLACCWRMTRRADGFTTDPDQDLWRAYVEDLYYVFLTVTTVGYGDIVPINPGPRLFSICMMLAAPFFSGGIVSSLTHFTKVFFDDATQTRIAEVSRYMARHAVPVETQRRVENNLHHRLRVQQKMDPELFSLLSPALQRELTLALLGNTVLQFPLFKDAPHSFVADVAQAHMWVHFSPGDLVVDEGQLMEELVFVVQGRLILCKGLASTDGLGADVESSPEVLAGGWFGEACLFENECQHEYTVYAVLETELALLPAQEYHRIKEKFPRLTERHQRIAEAIQKKKLCLKHMGRQATPQTERVRPHHRLFNIMGCWSPARVADSSRWQEVTP